MRSWQGVELVGGSIDVDLADNVPGQQARSRAVDEWTRVRSRRPLRAALARALNLPTEERQRRERAEGVELVGSRLNRLVDSGWFVLHAVPMGTADYLDHLVIGPGGVFAVDTWSVSGGRIRVRDAGIEVNGQPCDCLASARRHGERASEMLRRSVGWAPAVTPVIVFNAGRSFPSLSSIQSSGGVRLLDRLQVPIWFERRAPEWSEQQVLGLYESARLVSSWY